MKILVINTLYESYVLDFYSRNPGIEDMSYNEQKIILERDGFAWNGVWNKPFEKLGVHAENIYANVNSLQNAWAKENLGNIPDINTIIEEQIKKIQPEIIFIDTVFIYDNKWIDEIKRKYSFVRIVIGYVCSPSYHISDINHYDFIFTCLESIKKELLESNIKSAFLPHAFNPELLNIVINKEAKEEICFYGGFVRGAMGHGYREDVLTDIINTDTKIDIFSEMSEVSVLKDVVLIKSKKILFSVYNFLKAVKLPKGALNKLPYYSRISNWEDFKSEMFNGKLKKAIKKAKYGMSLYHTMLGYKCVLNIHGDLAKNEAANMRMFEVTGMGRLLITDWKPNLHLFFEDGKEVLSFKNSAECIEKIEWVKRNPEAAALIAKAGQQRTLKTHNFDLRAESMLKELRLSGLLETVKN